MSKSKPSKKPDTPSVKIKDLPLYMGGLFRCCIDTLQQKAEETVKLGDTITCVHCKKPTMVVAYDAEVPPQEEEAVLVGNTHLICKTGEKKKVTLRKKTLCIRYAKE